MNFEVGIFDRVRLVSNVLMLLLLAGNIFFSIQYTQNNIQNERMQAEESAKSAERIQMSRLMKFFIDTVLNSDETISLENRVKLENDVRQIHDADLIKLWDNFVASKDGREAQENAVDFMAMLANKML